MTSVWWLITGSLDTILSCRIPLELKQQVEAFRTRYHLVSTTKAPIDLLRIALFVDEKRGIIEDPSVVKFLQERLYDQQLVDWIYELPIDRLEALFSAFNSARELRFKNKIERK